MSEHFKEVCASLEAYAKERGLWPDDPQERFCETIAPPRETKRETSETLDHGAEDAQAQSMQCPHRPRDTLTS